MRAGKNPNSKWKIVTNGIVRNNPTFRLVLGTCPTLALTTAAMNGIYMGLATTFVLVCSNVMISLLRNIIPDKVRIPAYVLIIATFVTVLDMAMEYALPDVYEILGLYLPLIVVNCIILARAESFASCNSVGDSALDGLGMGIYVFAHHYGLHQRSHRRRYFLRYRNRKSSRIFDVGNCDGSRRIFGVRTYDGCRKLHQQQKTR